MKKRPETKPKTDDAIKAAIDASKVATPVPTLTDTEKLQLLRAAQAFDTANAQVSTDAIALALKQLMDERLQRQEAAKRQLNALGAKLGRAGFTLDAHTGIYSPVPK